MGVNPVNPIIIEDYNPLWPRLFETVRSRVASCLDGLTAAIEHVGSTAVPGLPAKPIIDIDVLLRSATDLPLVIARLASAGYEHRGDLGVAGREAFRTPPGDIPHHLYVCPPLSHEFRRHVIFRDYLRNHPEQAQHYGQLKRELAARLSGDREAYNQAKWPFVEEILRLAEEDG